ncbi:MAG: ATPase P, partial [Pseudomonadota bacterium]
GFCCAGCAYVWRLVQEHGLEGFYRIKDEIIAPADPAVFQPRDYGWLGAAQRAAEGAAGKIPELTLGVQGISCAACVWLIERIFQQQPGARDLMVNAQLGSMRLRWVRGEFNAEDFARKLQSFGYLAGPAGDTTAEPESRRLARCIGLGAAFAMNVMLFTLPVYFGMERSFPYARLFGLLSLIFATLSLLTGGTYFIGRAARALAAGAMHIDLPIALGITGAYAGSLYGWLTGEEQFVYFDFVSAFILLMLVGRWAQVAAVERNQRRLLALQPAARPVRLADGTAVAPAQLRAGQRLLLATGQTLPVEARMTAAIGEFSLASISGEAEPRLFRAGQLVPAGAVNLGRAAVALEARQDWAESLLARLLQPADHATWRHTRLERIVRGYLAGILGVALLAGLGWWLGTGDALRTGAVVTAVLVVSCPCAIGLAFPLADEMATVAMRRRGVFVRDESLWPRLTRVRKVVFDKTGTLTLETPVLRNPAAVDGLDASARAALFGLVDENPHPVCQCLREHVLARGADEALAGEVSEAVGFGLELGAWTLGRAGWRDAGPPGGDTVLACGGRAVARFQFADTVRADAAGEVAALQAAGLAVHILSGDR